MEKQKVIMKYLTGFIMAILLIVFNKNFVFAGTVTGNNMPEIDSSKLENISNPEHHCTQKNNGSDYTEWSYVYFGSYPQSEVLGNALTSAIIEASYDADGDAWVNGVKYRRIDESDGAYRYFKWERIKWRVLKKDSSSLLVMADKGLDCQKYSMNYYSIWENSLLRSWLNIQFYNEAFSNREQKSILKKSVIEESDLDINDSENDIKDAVFILSVDEVRKSEYGFCNSDETHSLSRQIQASDYAYRKETKSEEDLREIRWWLRSPVEDTSNAAFVNNYGKIDKNGDWVRETDIACIPVLQIKNVSDFWYVTDDESSGDGGGGNGAVINGTCGENVKYEFSSSTGTMRIFGTGKMSNYYGYAFREDWIVAPWTDAEYMSDIINVKIENGVTHIGNYVFYGSLGNSCRYKNLNSVEIADTVESIGDYAFNNCRNLESVSMPDNVKRIGESSFSSTLISDVHWSDSLVSIGKWAFSGTCFTEIQLPNQIQNIGYGAFSSCRQLIEAIIPDNCEVGCKAFSCCYNLERVHIGLNSQISGCVFYECRLLKDVFIGEGSIAIYEENGNENGYIFRECTSLQSIFLPDSWGFRETDGEAYSQQFLQCTNLKEIRFSDTNSKYKTVDGVVYSKDGKTLIYYPLALTDTEYEILDGTTLIGVVAFEDQKYLENVSIPESVNEIGWGAFYGCDKLNNIIIPDGIEALGSRVFTGCSNLNTIVLPASVKSIDLNYKAATETFGGVTLATIYGEEGSYAQEFASESRFKPIIYCIFDANGGATDHEKKIVIYNDKYRKLPIPVKEGYEFLGWYTEKESGNEITSNTFVTSEISHTIYAHWKKKNSSSNTEKPDGGSNISGDENNSLDSNPDTDESGNHTSSKLAVQIIQASSYTKEYGSKDFFIQASTSGNGRLTYQSSNQKVAVVSFNGFVKLKGYGTAVITINASKTSAYKAASKQITIKVVPKKVKLKKVQSPGKRRISMKWKKNKKAGGYEIYISSSKKFKSNTIRRTYPKSKTNVALIGLRSGKKYYVRIRAYVKVRKKTYYSEWSKTKSVKIK